MAAIPVIDYIALRRCGDGSQEARQALGELHRALSTIGFVYIINHEVEEHVVSVHSGILIVDNKLIAAYSNSYVYLFLRQTYKKPENKDSENYGSKFTRQFKSI